MLKTVWGITWMPVGGVYMYMEMPLIIYNNMFVCSYAFILDKTVYSIAANITNMYVYTIHACFSS